ncbi:MAG: hypothetical protein BJ554DRAFT_1154 [Olpidium bornovanus]|uniref:Uncharacterized protein n=1 Tax=Olpidium bornovanus TaxID=278681 RepID=A0A8H7ZSH6_9FUNG|nr:MAG: hypothetical protein BJ554DRAFT_1154 [Olpidium bornovanus]
MTPCMLRRDAKRPRDDADYENAEGGTGENVWQGETEEADRPRRKLRVCGAEGADGEADNANPKAAPAAAPAAPAAAPATAAPVADESRLRICKDEDVGIQEFVDHDVPGFFGVIKQRYTTPTARRALLRTSRFGRQVDPDGNVVHITDLPVRPLAPPAEAEAGRKPPPDAPKIVSPEAPGLVCPLQVEGEVETWDLEAKRAQEVAESLEELEKLIGVEPAADVKELLNSDGKKSAILPKEEDKSKRTAIHTFFKNNFYGRLATETLEGCVKVFRYGEKGGDQGKAVRRQKRVTWRDRGGEFCLFHLHKENKDTMEAVHLLARTMRYEALGRF